MKLKWN